MNPAHVVVGGGLAGMVAATHLAENGEPVIVLERGGSTGGDGNARISGGLFHLAWESMDASPERLRDQLDQETAGFIEPSLRDALADNSNRAMSWLLSHGTTASPKGTAPYMQYAVTPHSPHSVGRTHIAQRGTDQMVCNLYAQAREAGVDIVLGADVEALKRTAGGWRVVYRVDGRETHVDASQVLVADGGFQGNPELLTRYVGPNAADCLLRAGTASTGRGLRMLMEVGAQTSGLGRVYGHIVARAALDKKELWPHPTVDKLCLEGLLIGRDGRRHETSARDGVQLVNELARSEDPRGYTVVADATLWAEAGADSPYGAPMPNPTIAENGGTIHQADSIDELAQQVGLPHNLGIAIQEHNRSGRPITDGPFVALPIVPGITFTMGGARTDAHGRVLGESSDPLEGLWAAGSVAGGFHGGPHGGYIGGLAVALIYGLLSAESMLDTARTAQ